MLSVQPSGTRGLFAVPINRHDLISATHRIPAPLTAVRIVYRGRKKNQPLSDKYRGLVFHPV